MSKETIPIENEQNKNLDKFLLEIRRYTGSINTSSFEDLFELKANLNLSDEDLQSPEVQKIGQDVFLKILKWDTGYATNLALEFKEILKLPDAIFDLPEIQEAAAERITRQLGGNVAKNIASAKERVDQFRIPDELMRQKLEPVLEATMERPDDAEYVIELVRVFNFSSEFLKKKIDKVFSPYLESKSKIETELDLN